MSNKNHSIVMSNNIFIRIALATGMALLIPMIAMRFSTEFNWNTMDFALMGLLIFGSASAFVIAARKIPKKYWFILGVVCTTVFLFIWAELAVGIFTNLGS